MKSCPVRANRHPAVFLLCLYNSSKTQRMNKKRRECKTPVTEFYTTQPPLSNIRSITTTQQHNLHHTTTKPHHTTPPPPPHSSITHATLHQKDYAIKMALFYEHQRIVVTFFIRRVRGSGTGVWTRQAHSTAHGNLHAGGGAWWGVDGGVYTRH